MTDGREEDGVEDDYGDIFGSDDWEEFGTGRARISPPYDHKPLQIHDPKPRTLNTSSRVLASYTFPCPGAGCKLNPEPSAPYSYTITSYLPLTFHPGTLNPLWTFSP
jgi:hypothetical protein